ncbi:phytanoyl-CoA dioxygenase family protein [Ruania halotolerans]|uniref:phytanoyl-CoA dioxygenase family protein n=1 Tax=Ruania halotolerans TaxID=2897773 RepID=UPI001E47E379|nr:phytanoyl-CoA dioxygenase family protein [Ruania halotolerans]UFU06440.1 phytanoyl-CoA dioxygenase family protein [Ruania halotolerans]
MLTSNGYVLDERTDRLGALAETPGAERHDREALWKRLRSQGYLLLRQQLPRDQVLAFRDFYFSALAGTGLLDDRAHPSEGIAGAGPSDIASYRRILFDEIVPSREYQEFCTSPAIGGWFRWFMDADVHLHRRKILRHTRPGENGIGTATQAHYDLVYLREGTDRVLSMWIPLGDCPTSLGGLTYLEGTHHAVMAAEREGRLQRPAASITADLPHLADEYDSRWLVADYGIGDVLVHSAHQIHAALDNVNTDGRMRLSTDIRYQRRSEPIDWRWQEHWHDRDGL